jgi:hypothetical protein
LYWDCRAAEVSYRYDARAEQIDRLAGKSMPDSEWHSRKGHLIKGSKEFREMRGDQPNAKK